MAGYGKLCFSTLTKPLQDFGRSTAMGYKLGRKAGMTRGEALGHTAQGVYNRASDPLKGGIIAGSAGLVASGMLGDKNFGPNGVSEGIATYAVMKAFAARGRGF